MVKYYFFFLLIFSNILRAEQCSSQVNLKSYIPKYAKNFHIDYKKDFKIISTLSAQYLVTKNVNNITCNFNLKLNHAEKNIIMTSTTYLPSLVLLKKQEELIAFQGKKYIYEKNFNLNKIMDIGFVLNPENLLKFKPQLIMAYQENLQEISSLSFFYKLKLPLVISMEHLENSALGRAEWIIFNSAFFNEEEKAIEFYNKIESNYLKLVKKTPTKKKVLVGDIQNGFWVFPGAKSDFSQMLIDAGAELVLQVNSRATQKISLEELVKKNLNPDFWLLNNNFHSKKELDHPIYKKFKDVAIYNYIARKNKFGANDFWETVISRPDLVLNDLVMIFNNHDSGLQWYKKL